MVDNDEYDIAIIENEVDARVCAELLAEEFASHNPFVISTQATAQQLFEAWLWPLTKDVLDQKLSFFSRHRSTNEIVATIIASDLFVRCEKHPYDAAGPSSGNPISDLFNEMYDRFIHYELEEKLRPNMVLFISAGATRSQYSGAGIAAKLRAHLCAYVRDKRGFQYAFIQTMHPATRHIYVNKMNGKQMTAIDPATWIWKKQGDGSSCPMKDYKGDPFVNVLVKL